MNCERFRSLIERNQDPSVPRGGWDTPEVDEWIDHRLSCEACFDACLSFELVRRGLSPSDFPCVHAGHDSTCGCDEFERTGKCDNLTLWREPSGEFCIASRDGDLSGVKFCHRCGARWPEKSKGGWMKRPLPTDAALAELSVQLDEVRAFLLAPPPALDVSMPRSRVLLDEQWLERMRRVVAIPDTIPFLIEPYPVGMGLFCFELHTGAVVLFNDREEELQRWKSLREWLVTLNETSGS